MHSALGNIETLCASLLYLNCKIRLAFFTWPPSFTECDHLEALFLQGKCARDDRQLASPGGHYRQVFQFFTLPVQFIPALAGHALHYLQ